MSFTEQEKIEDQEKESAVHSLEHWEIEEDKTDVSMEYDDPINDVYVLFVLKLACVRG